MSETKCRICNKDAEETSVLGLCTEHREQIHQYILRKREFLTSNTKLAEIDGYTDEEKQLAEERIAKLAEEFRKAEARRKRREQTREALLSAPRAIAFILISIWNAVAMIGKSAAALVTCIGTFVAGIARVVLAVPLFILKIVGKVSIPILKVPFYIIKYAFRLGAAVSYLLCLALGLLAFSAGGIIIGEANLVPRLIVVVAVCLASRFLGSKFCKKDDPTLAGTASNAALLATVALIITANDVFAAVSVAMAGGALAARAAKALSVSFKKSSKVFWRATFRVLIVSLAFAATVLIAESISGSIRLEEIFRYYDFGIL